MARVSRPTKSRATIATLAIFALMASVSPLALAQTGLQTDLPSLASKADDTANAPILLQADSATFDAENGIYTARGNVQANYGDRKLTAAELEYKTSTNQITASGGVIITEKGGTTLYADKVVLDGTLETGLIETFGLLIDENARLAGQTAIRNDKTTEITQAVYSPCNVCKDENDGVPVWQIKALKVTHDRENKTISYRHAYLEILGVPILYTPYFWHADPAVKRQSGFLVPRVGNSTDLGNFLEIPYYWAIAPHYDLTIAPLLMTQEASVLKSEFRMRTKTGEFRLSGSITNPNSRDIDGAPVAGKQVRDHLFGQGRFTFNPTWNWGFDLQLTSDDTYLKRYDIFDGDELRNRGFARTNFKRNFTSIESYYFIGLRSTDNQGQTPVIVPTIDFAYHLQDPWLGGHVSFVGNFLSLQRTEGADMERLSLESRWERPYVSTGGHVVNVFADLRGDLYHTKDNQLAPDPITTNDVETSARLLPMIGAEWRFPLARPTKRGFQVIEPIAQIVGSPSGLNSTKITNEDSLSFEFDDTNLFKANKFPGLDRWEEGLRLNLGLKAALVGYGPGENSIIIGQTFRQDETTLFSEATGLDGKRSDYVGRIVLTPLSGLSMIHRFRIDKDDFSFRRNEIDLRAGGSDYWLETAYLRLGEELSESGLEEREELTARTHLKIRGNWSFQAQGIRNLARDEMIRASASLVYQDECTDFEITARRRFTEDRDIEPATSIFFRVKFKSLG